MDEILLSICVPTYNHEKYIGEALDSILMQKTSYRFEVLVGEDDSTDGTKRILKQYEEKYPNFFQMIYRKKNMSQDKSLPLSNSGDLHKRCQGKYVITLEGDDFWTDPYKIDTQVRFLEEHPDYMGVAHNCVVVDAQSKLIDEKYPECKESIYTLRHFGSKILPGQTATIMYRNIYKDHNIDISLLSKGLIPGDRLLCFVLASYGNIYCIQKTMSAYRHITFSGSSFSATYRFNYKMEKGWYSELVHYARKINNKYSMKYADLLYMKLIIGSRNTVNNSASNILKELKEENFKKVRYFQYLLQFINRKLFHKKIWA